MVQLKTHVTVLGPSYLRRAAWQHHDYDGQGAEYCFSRILAEGSTHKSRKPDSQYMKILFWFMFLDVGLALAVLLAIWVHGWLST